MIVVDASVLASALIDDTEDGDVARARLQDDRDLHAPHLVDVEVLSVLRRARAEARRLASALDALDALRLMRYPHRPFSRRIWELRDNVTPYDAAYVAIAEMLGCALVTADARLARATGPRCLIEVVG